MKKAIVIVSILALVMMMIFATAPMNANAATVVKISPESGKPGMPVVVHGSGFKVGSVVVKFGYKPTPEPRVLNDKAIQVEVPPRSILDPNPVKVTVTVDDVPAIGNLWYTYDPPGPEPTITGVDPVEAIAGVPFTVTFTGAGFTTPHGRQPNQIFLIGPDTIEGRIFDGTTDNSFAAEFLAAGAGIYFILVGFSDGSGARAEGFQIRLP